MKTEHNRKGCRCPKGSLINFCLGEKEKEYTATFSGKRYEQLERLSEKCGSKLKVITRALDLLEDAKNL